MISLRCLLFSVLSIGLLFVATRTVNAYSCGPRPSVLETFEDSDEVVILRAISVNKVPDTEDQRYVDGVRSTSQTH
jgi:hypothetical protein